MTFVLFYLPFLRATFNLSSLTLFLVSLSLYLSFFPSRQTSPSRMKTKRRSLLPAPPRRRNPRKPPRPSLLLARSALPPTLIRMSLPPRKRPRRSRKLPRRWGRSPRRRTSARRARRAALGRGPFVFVRSTHHQHHNLQAPVDIAWSFRHGCCHRHLFALWILPFCRGFMLQGERRVLESSTAVPSLLSYPVVVSLPCKVV